MKVIRRRRRVLSTLINCNQGKKEWDELKKRMSYSSMVNNALQFYSTLGLIPATEINFSSKSK